MGCWNETCDLSKLPIRYGDKVKFLILLNVGAGGKSYYYNDTYIPLALPLSGEYNDYGSVENIKIDQSTLNFLSSTTFYVMDDDDKEISDEKLERFSNTLKHYGCNSVSYIEMNSILNFKEYEFVNIEEFINDISAETIFFKYHDRYYYLQLIMYHEDLYDCLVKTFGLRTPYGKKDTISLLWSNKIKKYLDERKEYNSLRKIPEEELDKESRVKLFRFEFGEPVFKTSQYSYNFIKEYEKYIDESNTDEFIKSLTDYILFSYVLSYGRNGYYTTSGLGSQGEERYIQKQIAQWIIDFCNEKEAEALEEYEDDSDGVYGIETIFWRD